MNVFDKREQEKRDAKTIKDRAFVEEKLFGITKDQ
jgi:hypothetical protein